MLLKNLIDQNKFVLYVVTDDKFLPRDADTRSLETLKDIVKMCADGGAKIFQYRAKKLDMYIQFKQAETIKHECDNNNLVFAVNDRADLAYILGSQILHVGQEDIPPYAIKKKFPELKIGFSTHNMEQVKGAMQINELLDYISFGPVFGTTTKENPYPKTGIDDLKWTIENSKLPVVAIGGINDKNLDQVILSGARAIAMISFVLEDTKKIRERCELIIKRAQELM